MKRILVLALGALLLFGCHGAVGSPSEITERILSAAQAGNYRPFVDSFDLPDSEKDYYKALMDEKGKEYIASKGGIRSAKVVNEKVTGKSACVTVKLVYGTGASENMFFNYKMVDGKWLQEFSK